MANYNKKISETSARLGEVRFSFCNLFNRRKTVDGSEGKYGMCVLIPKTDTATLRLIEECVEAAKQNGKEKFGGRIPANLKMPLRDGDDEHPDDESFEGMMFFNCSSTNAPGLRMIENGDISEPLGDEDLYSGCWGCVTVNCFAYNSNGNRGVGIGLNNVLKTRDDERLGGSRPNADAEFADLAGASYLD